MISLPVLIRSIYILGIWMFVIVGHMVYLTNTIPRALVIGTERPIA
jgi:hypothetical protein